MEILSGKKSQIEVEMPVLSPLEGKIIQDFFILSHGRGTGYNSANGIKYSEAVIYFQYNYLSRAGFDSLWLETILALDQTYINHANKQSEKSSKVH